MRKLLTATALLAVLVATSAPVSAQTNGNGNGEPANCAAAVTKLQDSVGLRVQQYNGEGNRQSVNMFLQVAANAAATGNEALCWTYVKRAQQVVR
jgi:hypothetical protein